MNIAAKGQPNQIEELRNLISSHPIVPFKINEIDSYDVVFDLDFDDTPEQIQYYMNLKGKVIIVGSVKIQLEELLAEAGELPNCPILGMNTLPTFINRSLLEVCALNANDQAIAEAIFAELDLKSRFVSSRVGLVTPRIVCMIINEAYFTVQEGTATREDIDLGMKLGTAYPKGPFEWSREIGLDHVYETLEALYQDTKDERYKICPLLKTEYLQAFINE
ncbi:3-hydroxyacyl-CoA dehydrogenase family protein [Bacteroidia bacterium]|nr:3-hydroxyacyl-CoA dehydrogenase family protein [Bacteroidia bacterium]MDB4107009.1 3-hydroxyacyl-CoA dehydrogenase family protein [Bacteroidia bacterium]MDB9882468.1 3-hydroxyacyl-CoA dehydrogenase family protein [Bacteroidia bacterium]